MSRRRNTIDRGINTDTARICGKCPRPITDPKAHICGHCTDALLDDLIELADWLLDELDSVCAGERGVDYAGAAGGGDGDFVNWRAAEARDQLRIALWHVAACGVGAGPTALRERADQLTRHTDTISRHPDAPKAAAALSLAKRAALRLVDLPPDRQLVGPCPSCLEGRVYADPVSDYGRCDTCHERHDAAHLWNSMLDALEDQHVNAAEAARLALVMGLTENREAVRKNIRNWNVRGQITVHTNPDGETVYRFGDVWSKLTEGKATP